VKILVIRFSSIGDIVLTSPVLRCLKKQMPQARVHYLTKKRNADLLEANPYIDHIHLFDNDLDATINELRKERFDLIIDLHHNLRTLQVKRKLRVRAYSFRKLNFLKFLFASLKINLLPKMHIVDRYLDTVKHLDIKNDEQGLDYFIPEYEEFPLETLPEAYKNGFIALVLGGTYFTKRLPASKYRSILDMPNKKFILLGGKHEKEIATEIMNWQTGNVLDYVGKLTINQSATLIRESSLVITNDTGLMHIAAAFRKKILSVWGNTVPEFGMVPYFPDPQSEILEVKNLSCRPCSKLGYHKCPKKHFRCMNDIPEQKIIEWIERQS
jgi:ADP-heptose:LPS heptosyltransferase